LKLEEPVIIVGHQIADSRSEPPRLHDHHNDTIRQWRMVDKASRRAV